MSLRLACLLLALGLSTACSRVEEQVVSALFQNYVSAQTALANDNYDEAKKALIAMANEADEDQVIMNLAKEVADCENIDTARKKFKHLSEAVKELPLPEGHVVAYCPMADDGNGASWVQTKGDLKNPYYGSKMLECGEITKTR